MHKVSKLLGGYINLDRNERLPLVNQMFNLYIHGHAHKEEDLTDLDHRNLEDLLTIAVEILNETKWFDPSMLNPINFMQLSLLEFGLQKNP